ncbi:unnamed protein product [Lasius platythorax]|uniref:MADF domain-containing protein n=1 Tax=Lasius platythorax TaxID=488582 RepID=A0AAV2MY70_9HYME
MSYETNQLSTMQFINDENSSSMEYNSEDVNELIIHYVRSRPQLWDFKNKQYRDNVLKKKLWCEVAQELNVTDEFVKNRWRNLRDRYIKEKKKSITKSGQAALHCSPWPLTANLSFLSDAVEPRKTVTNYQSFGIERPLSIDTLSPAPSETFETEEYVHNAYVDTQEEFQVHNMPRPNSASPRPNSLNSASPRLNSVLPRPPRASSRTPSILPHSESISPRPWSASYLRDLIVPRLVLRGLYLIQWVAILNNIRPNLQSEVNLLYLFI